MLKDRKRVADELRPVYAAGSIDVAEDALAAFDEAWGERYPMIAASDELKLRADISAPCVRRSERRIGPAESTPAPIPR